MTASWAPTSPARGDLDAADTLPDLTSPEGPGGGDLSRFEDYVESVLAEW